MDKKVAMRAVYQAIDAVNGMRPPAEQLPHTSNVVLFGEGGALDSLGFVTLVLAIERAVAAETGAEIDIIGLDAFDPGNSSGQTAESIAEIIAERVE